MATIPGWLLRHRVTVEPYLGEGANGPSYGPPVADVRAFVEEASKTVRSADGTLVTLTATVLVRLSVVAPDQSRVTLADGRTATVYQAKRRDGGGLPTPDHLELQLI